MEILIKGNKNSFQLYKKIEYLDIKLHGSFSLNLEQPVYIDYGDIQLKFSNRQRFYTFSEKVKGASLEKIILLSQEYQLNPTFTNSLIRKGEIEIGLFKSIFLIYSWIEIAITDAYAVNISDMIYNKFLIDYSGKPEVQKDIYFLDSKYIVEEYSPILQKLMDLNLLVSCKLVTIAGNFQTFFIPLIKPGVSREYFKTDFDKNGNKIFDFWKKILDDRDAKIRHWINYRNQ